MAYTERRKADRLAMASAVHALALEYGCEAAIEDKPYGDLSPQESCVRIRANRGLCLTVDFDGRSPQPDVHVLSWHMATDTDARLADAFCPSLNTSHYCKATDVAYGFDHLLATLRKRLALAQSGEAFSAEREAASILKDGTGAEREARWAKWRAEGSSNAG